MNQLTGVSAFANGNPCAPIPPSFALRESGVRSLLSQTQQSIVAEQVHELVNLFERPNDFIRAWAAFTGQDQDRLHMVGPLEARLAICAKGDDEAWLFTFGDYGVGALEREALQCFGNTGQIGSHCWLIPNASALIGYVSRPVIYLAALYHPENFPLPRFSLAISDLLRIARQKMVSRIHARDMQLGLSPGDIIGDIARIRPDIVGISATFGQHDILTELLNQLPPAFLEKTTLVIGGSLAALNSDVILARHPMCLVGTGPGEPTIAGLIDVRRGRRSLGQVPALAYRSGTGDIVYTQRVSPRDVLAPLPELDLLEETLAADGVMQLESSRGCSYACSFCPRDHKGIWSGEEPATLELLLPDIDRILRRHPNIARRLFLVDEEFFGYRARGEAERRVSEVADVIHRWGLDFETSSRVDQVYREHKPRQWHLERIDVWRHLLKTGLSRCLFGIESGVDTILRRFNKKTTKRENIIAVRVLSLLGVPPRYTYITFDPFMTHDELIETCLFQRRTDLILRFTPGLSAEDIFDIAVNDEKAAVFDQGTPFYSRISYMLVSMECLARSPYTEAARRAGLLGSFDPNMGRYSVRYQHPEIGALSDAAQRWIDRNFSLDYLLKSIEKYSPGESKHNFTKLRLMLKVFSANLLEDMIKNIDCGRRETKEKLLDTLNEHFSKLAIHVNLAFAEMEATLPLKERSSISSALDRWAQKREWGLINGV